MFGAAAAAAAVGVVGRVEDMFAFFNQMREYLRARDKRRYERARVEGEAGTSPRMTFLPWRRRVPGFISADRLGVLAGAVICPATCGRHLGAESVAVRWVKAHPTFKEKPCTTS